MDLSSQIWSKRNCTVLNNLYEKLHSFINGSAWYGNQARSRGFFNLMNYISCANLYVITKLLVLRFRWLLKGGCFMLHYSYMYIVQPSKEQAKQCRRQSGYRICTVLCMWIEKGYETKPAYIDIYTILRQSKYMYYVVMEFKSRFLHRLPRCQVLHVHVHHR